MRIAVISDIHSNLAALEAVAADIEALQPDHVIVTGDFKSRGPEPLPVLKRLWEWKWPLLRGNHEDYVLGQAGSNQATDPTDMALWRPARWTAEQTYEYHEQVAALPLHLTLQDPQGNDLFFTHGSPRRNNEGIYPSTSDEALADMLSGVNASVVCVGHTHHSLIRHSGDTLVVNVGSVGLPFNGDWRAQYGILSFENGAWKAELRAIEYDRQRTIDAFERSGFLKNGGPMTTLILDELIDSRPYLGGFIALYADQVRSGILTLEEAIEAYRSLPPDRYQYYWPR